MIIGIGTDLVDIRRIEKTLDRYGERFKNKVFTPDEIILSDRFKHSSFLYANRFGGKESFSKAIGTGIRQGVTWRDIEVLNFKTGKPYVNVYNKAKAHLDRLTPKGKTAQIDITMTDEYPYSQIFVIISAF